MDDVTDVEVNDTVGSLSCVGDTFGSRKLWINTMLASVLILSGFQVIALAYKSCWKVAQS